VRVSAIACAEWGTNVKQIIEKETTSRKQKEGQGKRKRARDLQFKVFLLFVDIHI
jgi:hypothetical protein